MRGNTNRRRAVITGIGAVTPLGPDVKSTWEALKEGRSGVGPVTLFDASTFPSRIAAEVTDESFKKYLPDVEHYSQAGRNTFFGIAAAMMAAGEAGLDHAVKDPRRFGIYFASGEGIADFRNLTTIVQNNWHGNGVEMPALLTQGARVLNPLRELEQEPNMPAGHLAAIFNAQGPNLNTLTACAASSQAIGEATEIIRRGDADIMLSGGAHSMIHPLGMGGFCLLNALSTQNEEPTKASRPFDRKRDGFVLGEGGGAVILEELEFAKSRGAHIHAEVLGYGSTCDAFRITDMHPEGRGGIASMRAALEDAGVSPEDVDYINAHGTSTLVNDRIETLSIKKFFKENAYETPVSSTKSMTGHLIAAAGVAEIIACIMTIQDGVIPPTINYENPDPDCDLDYVPNQAREAKVDVVLSNSFGFGGQNVCLVVKKFSK
ncbi:MAG: 3-oxoacyl-ACP synthase [Planctomycetes bacterium DG_23]|nr:MAG: 3-oxoacyl-ACP synthase [Planctomycetes bacterium DG_23]